MADIVERLKDRMAVGGIIPIGSTLLGDAIAEIERLREMIEAEGWSWEPDPRTPEQRKADSERFCKMVLGSPEIMKRISETNAFLRSRAEKK